MAVVVLALDAGLSARRMLSGISAARNDLIDGGNSVVTGDPTASVGYFTEANQAAGSAVAAAGHPGIRLLGALPWIGDNIRAVRAVAEASQQSAQAGLSMADAAEHPGVDRSLDAGRDLVGRRRPERHPGGESQDRHRGRAVGRRPQPAERRG